MDFSHPHFAAPAWLWLALLAPAGFAALCACGARARARQLDALADPASRPRLLRSHSRGRRALKQALVAAALAAMGVTLARPQWGEQTETATLQGEDILIVLDCSKSMLTADVQPNRLERARIAILDFIRLHPGGRVGLVAFAGQGFVQCPLTFDYDAFRECLLAVDDKTIPVEGTDIARALDEAGKAMEPGARRKLMILVTDGEDLERGGVDKARELASSGVVIFTIGVGTSQGKPLLAPGLRGTPEFVRDSKGRIVVSRLDEPTLRAIARVTGGAYEPLGALGQGLARIREAIRFGSGAAQRKTAQAAGIDRFYCALAVVLCLLIVESLIGTRRAAGVTSNE